MNQTFSISRFGRLTRKYFTDNQGQLLANVALLIGGLFVLCLFVYRGYPRSIAEMRLILFFILGWACWYVFTMQQTAVVNQKEGAINYLMQPASQLEKILLIWLVSGIGFLAVYLSVFALFDAIGVSYVNNRDWTPQQIVTMRRMGDSLKIDSLFSSKSINDVPYILWIYTALLHSFSLAFSLLVRRYTLPLVVVIAFAIIIVGIVVNNSLLQTLTGNDNIGSIAPFAEAGAESPLNRNQYRGISLPQPLGDQIRYGVGIVVVVLLYVTAYFRLKEREV